MLAGGNGYVSLAIQKAGYEITLVEPGYQGAFNAYKRGVKNVVCSLLENAQFPQKSLSGVCLFDVLEHIENDEEFLGKLRNYLMLNGKVYLTVPAYHFLWSKEDEESGHYRRYTLKSLNRIFSNAGFRILYNSYFFSLLPLPIFILRTIPSLLNRKSKRSKSEIVQTDHIKQSPWLDRYLQLENRILEKSKIPFGGSCILVAEKI